MKIIHLSSKKYIKLSLINILPCLQLWILQSTMSTCHHDHGFHQCPIMKSWLVTCWIVLRIWLHQLQFYNHIRHFVFSRSRNVLITQTRCMHLTIWMFLFGNCLDVELHCVTPMSFHYLQWQHGMGKKTKQLSVTIFKLNQQCQQTITQHRQAETDINHVLTCKCLNAAVIWVMCKVRHLEVHLALFIFSSTSSCSAELRRARVTARTTHRTTRTAPRTDMIDTGLENTN